MNTQRMIVLGLAVIAAGAAALLARGLLGGGTPPVVAAPTPVASIEVLVAATNLEPGRPLTATQVRWQKWPKSDVDPSFITNQTGSPISSIVAGAVVRAPLVEGEPLTSTKVVHADATGFMAAMLQPGMRAVSISVTTESGAGGFILPNDRVDLLLTKQLDGGNKNFKTRTILRDVRVLAMDQTFKEDNGQKVVLAKTATLELTPSQAEKVARASLSGTVSLALRALGDAGATVNSRDAAAAKPGPTPDESDSGDNGQVLVVRYGSAQPANAIGKE